MGSQRGHQHQSNFFLSCSGRNSRTLRHFLFLVQVLSKISADHRSESTMTRVILLHFWDQALENIQRNVFVILNPLNGEVSNIDSNWNLVLEKLGSITWVPFKISTSDFSWMTSVCVVCDMRCSFVPIALTVWTFNMLHVLKIQKCCETMSTKPLGGWPRRKHHIHDCLCSYGYRHFRIQLSATKLVIFQHLLLCTYW